MAVGRDTDAATWLHNKLGSTDDLWSGSSICSQLTRERFLNIQDCFHNLQPHVKVKLMLSFLHLPKRNVEEYKTEMEEILQMAQEDGDQWVAMVGDILKTYPATGSLNSDVEICHTFFHEVLSDLRKLVKKSQDIGMLPMECPYLSRSAMMSIAGQQAQPIKHFALKRKPKSAALRADLLQKSSEVANSARRNGGITVPLKIRSFAKKMDDTTPLRGIPSSKVPQSGGGFIRSSSLTGRFGTSTPLGQSRSSIIHKEGGIKLLDITEQPIGSKEAKRRKKLADNEAHDQLKKSESQPAVMPDYAAGLIAPELDDVSSNKSALTYVPEAGSGIGDSLVPLSSEKIATTASPITVNQQTFMPSSPAVRLQQFTPVASQSVAVVSASSPGVNIIQLRPTAAGTPLQLRPVAAASNLSPFTQTLSLPGVQQVMLRAVATSSGVRLPQPGAVLLQRPLATQQTQMLIRPGSVLPSTPTGTFQLRPVATGLAQPSLVHSSDALQPGLIQRVRVPTVQPAAIASQTLLPAGVLQQAPRVTTVQATGAVQQNPTALAIQTPANQPANQVKKGLSLTKEQMIEAQEMFKTSNKVTRPEKALILGFMAGSRDNPCPTQGDIISIRLSEIVDTVQTPEGVFRPMVIETYFQMNYATGESKRVVKMREKEPDVE